MTDIIERLRAASKGTPEWRLKSPSGGIAMWGDEEWKLRDYLSRQQANGAFLGYHVIREFAENSGDELRLAAANEIARLRANITTMETAARAAIEIVRKEKDAEILRLRVAHHEDTASLHETIAEQKRIIECLMCGMPEDGTTPVIRRIAKLEEDAARLDYIASNARCDHPKMDGRHVWWTTSFGHRLFGPTLRAAIDAAMKDKP